MRGSSTPVYISGCKHPSLICHAKGILGCSALVDAQALASNVIFWSSLGIAGFRNLSLMKSCSGLWSLLRLRLWRSDGRPVSRHVHFRTCHNVTGSDIFGASAVVGTWTLAPA